MSSGDADRKTILRRRAFLVTSALAALGSCGRATTSSGESEPRSVISIPGSESDAGEIDDVPAPTAQRDAAAVEGMPPMDVPEGLSPFGKSQYEQLYQSMNRMHGLLTQIENELPSCNILEGDCERRFSRMAANFNAIDDQLEGIAPCGGNSADARAYAARVSEHLTFLQQRRRRAEDQIAERLGPGGESARARWRSLREAAATPRPCLEYACPEW